MEVSHVSIKVSDAGHNLLTLEEFACMSFDERMKLISSKSITFLDENGQKISLLDGVRFTTEYLRRNPN